MSDKLADFLEVFGDVNKTAVMLLIMAIGVILRVYNLVDGGSLTDLLKTTTLAYFGTTTVVHFTSMVKDHLASTAKQVLDKVEGKKEDTDATKS